MSEEVIYCPICQKTGFTLFLNVKDYFLTKEIFSIYKCDNCWFKFISPRPDNGEINRYYQSDEYISHDSKKTSLLSQIYKFARKFSIKSKYKIVRKYIQAGKILDIGCGTGEFLNYCKSKGFDITGVEPSEKAGSYAQQVNNVPVIRKLTDLKPIEYSFDCITMWHVLEHIHDLNDTITLVKRLLAVNAVLVVAVPNCDSWDAQKYSNFWAAYDVPRHLYHFNGSTLSQLVSNHGFEILKVIPQKLDAFYVSMLSEKYQSGRINYLKSFFFGFWSNFQARKFGRGYSSQIFILSVKKS